MADVLPCPFCGSEPHINGDNYEHTVFCGSGTCSVGPKTDRFDHEIDAIAAWNKRATPAERPGDAALAERLRALDAMATQGVLAIEHPLGDDIHSIVQANKEPYEWVFFANVSPDDDDDGSTGQLSPAEALANAQLIVALVNAYRAGALSPAPRDGGWLPIESAPRDGTYVLGYGPHEEMGHYIEAVHVYNNKWTIEWMHGYGSPTRWRPLPAAPTEDGR